MKLDVAFDNLAKFFEEGNEADFTSVPAEIFKDERGNIQEIRLYNTEYEQLIIIDRSGNVEALSVKKKKKNIKFK